jgi:hypothetical protein
VLGSEGVQTQIAAASGRRATRLPKGRPPLEDEIDVESNLVCSDPKY